MRISTLLGGAVIVLCGIAVGASTWLAYDANHKRSRAALASVMARALVVSARLIEAVTLERSPYSATLAGDPPASHPVRREAAERRAVVDELMKAFSDTLEDPRLDQVLRQGLAAISTELAQTRRLADSGFDKEKTQRAPNIAEEFLGGLHRVTTQVRKSMALLKLRIAEIDPMIATDAQVVALSTDLRDIAGVRSSYLTQFVASRRPPDSNGLTRLSEAEGQVAYIWAEIERLVGSATPSNGQFKAYEDARDRFWLEGSTRYREVTTLARQGATPTITIEQWRPWTLDALATVVKLRDASIVEMQEAEKTGIERADRIFMGALVGLSLSLVIAVFSITMIRKRVIRPLTLLEKAITAVSEENYEVALPDSRNNDEISRIGEAVRILARKSQLAAELRNGQAAEQARAQEERRQYVERISSQFRSLMGESIEAIRASAQALETKALGMHEEVNLTVDSIHNAVARSGEAASNVSAISAAAEELTCSARETGILVRDSADFALRASSEISSTADKMSKLGQSVLEISGVILVIRNITKQINLLALNASIEAARAGEAGKGFSIVASQVKELADQTDKAMSEIVVQMEDVQSEERDTIEALKLTVGLFEKIDGLTKSASVSISEQIEAVNHIAINISDASEHTQATLSKVQNALNYIVSLKATSDDLTASAVIMKGRSNKISDDMNSFLENIE